MLSRWWQKIQSAEVGVGTITKAALLTSLLVGVFGVRYLAGSHSWTLAQGLYFFALLIGQFFCLSWLLFGIVACPLAKLRQHKTALAWIFAVATVMLVLLVADTYVYGQFRLHINLAMLEMTFFGGGQIVVFSPRMIAQIASMVCGLAVIATCIVLLSVAKLKFTWGYGLATAFVLMAFVAANLTYAVAFPVKNTLIMTVTERVPYAQPLRMTKLVTKLGIVTKEDIERVKTVKVADNSAFHYPMNPLQCSGTEKPMNIVFLYIDSMRHDVFNAKNTPNLWKFSQTKDTSIFENYFSGGNCTRTGVFSAFYGIPGKYWSAALSSNTPAALITAMKQRDFAIGTFASTTLTNPEFNATIFAGVNNLRINPRGGSVFERDQVSVDDFIAWQRGLPKEKPFFSFIFLDTVHACNVPEDEKFHVFKPFWQSVNQLELNSNTDPIPYFNRYRNSAYWIDTQIGRVISHLEKENLLDNTIVVVSSDHGDEFNDNGLNYWGHNGNYTAAQIQVSLVVHWPGKKARVVKDITSSADLTATLLPEALGCTNAVTDYSTGELLWSEKRTKNWLHSASYSTHALIEPNRIILIDKFGMLQFQDKTTRPAKDESLPVYLKQAVDELTRYYRK